MIAFERLERSAGKLACCVLMGAALGNGCGLPDSIDYHGPILIILRYFFYVGLSQVLPNFSYQKGIKDITVKRI